MSARDNRDSGAAAVYKSLLERDPHGTPLEPSQADTIDGHGELVSVISIPSTV